MKYYSTQRPISPGSIPGDGLANIENFGTPHFVPEISREAWGWAEYNRDLSENEISDYELVPAGMRIWWSVIKTERGDKTTASLGPVTEAAEQPEKRFYAGNGKRVLMTWMTSREAAERLVDDLRA